MAVSTGGVRHRSGREGKYMTNILYILHFFLDISPHLFKNSWRLSGRAHFNQGEGMPGRKIPRGKRKLKRRGTRCWRKSFVPRLALWAGVGVFVLALLASCGDDGPTEPTPTPPTPSGEGFVWAYTERVWNDRWLLKIDIGTGEIFHYGAEGFDIGTRPVGIPADVDTGEFFLHLDNQFLTKYSPNGRRVWKTGTPYHFETYGSLAYYKKGKAIWAFGPCQLDKYNAATGERVLSKWYSGLSNMGVPIQVDQRDGSVWAASSNYLLKVSSRGTVLYEEHYEGFDRTIANMAINEKTGELCLVIYDTKPYKQDLLIKYAPSGKKLLTKTVFANAGGPEGMAIDPANGNVWLGYKTGVVVHDARGDYKKILPHYDRVRTFAFARDKAILAGGDSYGYFNIQAINKATGREYWRIYSQVTSGIRGIEYVNK